MHTGQKYFWRSGVIWRLVAACLLSAASQPGEPGDLAGAGRAATGGAPFDRDRTGFRFPGWL